MKHKKPVNVWKWAFIVVVILILGFSIYIYTGVTSTTSEMNTGEVNTEEVSRDSSEMTFDLSTNKEAVTQLVNIYLDEATQGDFIDYEFVLDEQAEIHGSFEIFGLNPQFSMYLEPQVLDNGNIVFNAQELSIGSLDLPISLVLSQLSSQIDLPDFIVIDSGNQEIDVNLNEFELENGISFSANEINLDQNNISVTIHLPPSAIQ